MTVAEKVKKLLKKNWTTTKQLNKAVGSSSGERRMRELREDGFRVVSKFDGGSFKYKIKG